MDRSDKHGEATPTEHPVETQEKHHSSVPIITREIYSKMNFSVSSINTKRVLKNDISDICGDICASTSIFTTNKYFQVSSKVKVEVLLLENTDYCRKQPFTLEVPFRVPTVVTLSLRRLKDRERFLSPKLKSE